MLPCHLQALGLTQGMYQQQQQCHQRVCQALNLMPTCLHPCRLKQQQQQVTALLVCMVACLTRACRTTTPTTLAWVGRCTGH